MPLMITVSEIMNTIDRHGIGDTYYDFKSGGIVFTFPFVIFQIPRIDLVTSADPLFIIDAIETMLQYTLIQGLWR